VFVNPKKNKPWRVIEEGQKRELAVVNNAEAESNGTEQK